MPTARKIKKKSSPKRIRKVSPQRGKLSEKLIFAVVGILVLLALGIFFWKPWQGLHLPFTSQALAIEKPKSDFGRARQLTIDPAQDTIMQVRNREGVIITLEVPAGAIKEKTNVTMIPFYQDTKTKAPTAGVIIGPATVEFLKPVTLSFDLSNTEMRSDAPKNALAKQIRATGKAHVMQLDSQATTLTPTLIARGIETATYLPARIMGGGAYVFSLDGDQQVAIAQKALQEKKLNSLMTMESASTILGNEKKLSGEEEKHAKAAVVKILKKDMPPAAELYAALLLQKQIQGTKFSFISSAYAFDTAEGTFQILCKQDKSTVEEYLGFARSAQLLGHDSIAESCINKAKNLVAEEAKKVLADPNADLKTVIVTLQNVQLVGVGDDSNLDERLVEKAKEVTTENGKKVADDPNSSAIDAAIALQQMEAVGADTGPTHDTLQKKLEEFIDQKEADAEGMTEEYENETERRTEEARKIQEEVEKEAEKRAAEYEESSIQEEEIMSSAVMSALGVAMLKVMGFDELDEASLKERFSKMTEEGKMLNEAAYAMCKEFDGDDCDKNYSYANQALEEAEREGYRVAAEVGATQSQEYETPEYTEENGDYEMYFEIDLTPTPEGEEMVGDEYTTDEEYTEENYDENSYDYGPESQGTSESDDTGSGEAEGTNEVESYPEE